MKPGDVSPLYNLTGPSNVSINGLEMAQNLIAPAAWSLAILRQRPSLVIEIGTSKGGLSSILSSCTSFYGGEFHTFDIHGDGSYNQYPLHGRAEFHQDDCFEVEDLIGRKISLTRGQCFILCDGGDKTMEFNAFSQYLKPGDIIAAHDWCDETVEGYSPLYWGWCETHTSNLKLDGLKDFMPEWFYPSAWIVKQKI